MKMLKILCASFLLISTCAQIYGKDNTDNKEIQEGNNIIQSDSNIVDDNSKKVEQIQVEESKEDESFSYEEENIENEQSDLEKKELNQESESIDIDNNEEKNEEIEKDDTDVEKEEAFKGNVVDDTRSASIDAIDQLHIKTYPELVEALASANDGDMLALDNAFDLASLVNNRMELITPSVSVTIDGQGVNLLDNAITVKDGTGSLTLKNFNFDGGGQAVYVSSKGTVVFDNFKIMNGVGANGGAINIDGGGMSGNFTLKNSTLLNNSSYQSGYTGGGIYTDFFNGIMTIENNVFDGNKTKINGGAAGGQGGAIFIKRPGNGSSIMIRNNYFTNNEANINNVPEQGNPDLSDGGAIALFDIKTGADISVDSNTFYNNIAGADGGAMLVQFDEANTTTRIRNNTFYKNIAMTNNNSSDNSGGAIQLFHAGKVFTRSTIELSNNTFVVNKAGSRGGAVGSSGAPLRFIYSKLIDNIFVDNKGGLETYNNFSGMISLDQNNIGVDAGTVNTVSVEDVFGTKGNDLYFNKSSVKAGSSDSRVSLKTLPIVPNGLADNVESSPVNTLDQRNFARNSQFSDLGSVEIKYIEFNANGGEWNDEVQTYYDGNYYHESNSEDYFKIGYNDEPLDLDVSSFLSRDNYVLEEFNTEADGSGTAYTTTAIINRNEDLKVYAIWKAENPAVKYTLSYNGNGNTSGIEPIDSKEYLENEEAIIMDKESLEKVNATFLGWNIKADGSGKTYDANDKIAITEDTTLYAMWSKDIQAEEKYTVVYDGNGNTSGNAPVDSKEYLKDESANIMSKDTLVKEGYKFVAWNTEKDGSGLTYKESDTIEMIKDVSLYAMWAKESKEEVYSITYFGNGNTSGNAPLDVLEYALDARAKIMGQGELVKIGYVFNGWNTMKDGSGLKYNDKSEVIMSQNLELFAQWTKIGSNINGGITNTNPKQASKSVETGLQNNALMYSVVIAGLMVVVYGLRKKEQN